MRILDDVDEREIGNDMGVGQRAIGERDEEKLHERRRPRHAHQRGVVEPRAREGNRELQQRQSERENERVMSGLDDHLLFSPCHTPCSLQLVRDVLGHVALVMLGEHAVGLEFAVRLQLPVDDDALPFAEEVRQQAGVGDVEILRAVGDGEGDILAALDDAAFLHQPADAQPRVRGHLLLSEFGGRVEEDDIVAQREQHQPGGDAERREGADDKCQSLAFARHVLRRFGPRGAGQPPILSSFASSSMRAASLSLPASALRASSSAFFAFSGSDSTL